MTTVRQAWQRIDRLERQAWLGSSPFEGDNAERQAIRLVRGWLDIGWWFQTYLPHYFTAPPAAFHRELIEICDVERFAAVAAPRGHAKSTVITFGHSLWELAYRRFWYQQILSSTRPSAEEFVGGIREEIEDNERIRRDFGPLADPQGTWTDGVFITSGSAVALGELDQARLCGELTAEDVQALAVLLECRPLAVEVAARLLEVLHQQVRPRLERRGTTRVEAFGRGQKSVRGRRHGPHRPDRIKLDDVEDDEQAANPDQVDKVIRWFTGAVLPGLAPATDSSPGRLFLIGTILASYSLLGELLRADKYRRFRKVRVAAIVVDPESGAERALWPERWPLSELAEMREDLGEEEFTKEYLSEAPDAAGKPFPTSLEDYARYRPEELAGMPLQTNLWCDPALGRNRQSDSPAILLTHWVDAIETLFIEVAEVDIRRPEDTCRRMVELQRDHGLLGLGTPARYEDVGFQELMQNLHERIAHEMGIRGAFAAGFKVPEGDKDTRIRSLGHPVARARVRFFDAPSLKPVLRQFAHYPKGRRDGPDLVATAYKFHARSTAWSPAYHGQPRSMQWARKGAW